MQPVPTDPQRSTAPLPGIAQAPWPDNLSQIVSDLATTVGRLDGLTTALDGIGHRGEAVAANHIAAQIRNIRFRLDRIQRWTGL